MAIGKYFLVLIFFGICLTCKCQPATSELDNSCKKDLKDVFKSLEKIYQAIQQPILSATATRDLSCPPGFNHSGDGVYKCYSVISQPMTWEAAQDRCKTLHQKAHLTVINSELENEIIADILDKYDCPNNLGTFWTSGQRRGLNCSSSASRFAWKYNIRANQELDYTKWCSWEPNCLGGRQHCLSFAKACHSQRGVSGWQDDRCSEQLCSVCEILKLVRS